MPDGAFYAFPSFAGLIGKRNKDQDFSVTDEEIAEWLLDEAKVATVPGTPFRCSGFTCASYACSEHDIDQGIAANRRAIAPLT